MKLSIGSVYFGLDFVEAPDSLGRLSDWVKTEEWHRWWLATLRHHGLAYEFRSGGVDCKRIPMLSCRFDDGSYFRMVPKQYGQIWHAGPHVVSMEAKGLFWPTDVIHHDAGFTLESTLPELGRWIASDPVRAWRRASRVYAGTVQTPGFIGEIHFGKKT